MSKKILQICAIDLSVDALLKPLILKSMEEGFETHNVCTNQGRFEALQSEGLHMVNVKIDRHIHPVKNIKTIWNLYRLMKKNKYDIVHVHTPIAALLGRIAAKLAGTKHIIYTAHGFYFHEDMPARQYKLFYNIEKYAARFLTDWLLLQSKEDYELCVNENFIKKDRVIHISNGVDIQSKFSLQLIQENKLFNLKQQLGIQENDTVFMFIGRLVKEKGIFELLEAFQMLQKKHSSAKLLIVGDLPQSERDHASFDRLQGLLRQDGVIALGFRKDIPLLLAMSNVFVLPSYREGLPRSIIEAMAMEKPIIATNIRGCREEVFPGQNGFLVNKQDYKDLHNAMEKLLNKQVREKFGQESRKIVEELFNEEKVIQKQIDLFHKLSKEV